MGTLAARWAVMLVLGLSLHGTLALSRSQLLHVTAAQPEEASNYLPVVLWHGKVLQPPPCRRCGRPQQVIHY
jgi:hypothetical protein